MKVKKTKLTPSPHPSKAGPIVGDEIKRKSLNLGIAKKWRMGGVAWVVVVVVVVVGLWGGVGEMEGWGGVWVGVVNYGAHLKHFKQNLAPNMGKN